MLMSEESLLYPQPESNRHGIAAPGFYFTTIVFTTLGCYAPSVCGLDYALILALLGLRSVIIVSARYQHNPRAGYNWASLNIGSSGNASYTDALPQAVH